MEKYLLINYKQNIIEILEDENVDKNFPVNINFLELFDNDTGLGNQLLKDPEEALDELENWILHVQDVIFQQYENKDKVSFKFNVHPRVYGLPACPELHRTILPRAEDVDAFLQISATVIKTKDSKMLEYQRPYKCSKCKHIQMVQASYEQYYVINPPRKCLNPERCPGKNFTNCGALNADNCKDYQEIKIQEQTSNLNSTMAASFWVTLEDDQVDTCKPGDDVTICGIVKRRWGPLVVGKKIVVELAFKANHIQVHNGNTVPPLITAETRDRFTEFWREFEKCPLKGRDLILKSFCPKLYGMYLVKLAMAVILAGGSNYESGSESGVQKRSEAHILLVGDPGTGKSQLLRYASKIVTRSVLTTGVGSTSAGLTVAAIMEEGQWQLEAGALVLADGGICCIDEFNSMKSHDRASIHEAMEQQTISVAKAGIHCKLRTRCTIIAATNPKGGHLDSFESLSLNLAISSSLLSRFDLVLMLKDTYRHEWDSLIADHILNRLSIGTTKVSPNLWELEMLQQYFTVIKSTNPVLTTKADQILAAYYQAQRQAATRNKSRTTVRLLENLIRLSQGHAKLMNHNEVFIMDAIFAIILIESSMHGECAILLLEPLNVLESFPEDSMQVYTHLATTILTKLELTEILNYEINFLKEKFSLDVLQNSNITESIDHSTNNENSPETTNDENFIPSKKRENVDNHFDALNVSTINDSFNITKNSENLNEIPITDTNKKRKMEIPEMHKNKNKKDSSNILNLIKSVHDDFDLNFVSNISQEVADFNLNTQTRNIQKKFKFVPKEKIHLKQFSDDTSENMCENVDTNLFGKIINNFNSEKICNEEPKTDKTGLVKKVIPNEETTKMKESPLSIFKFVPRNLPSTTTTCASTTPDVTTITCSTSTMLNNVNVENTLWDNNNIFQTEEEDIDFLDLDI
ncbi:hypothetical protein FQA39_LY09788 [Lamprigera yunnana]|nr:hypothetical protein FQA39_LY09788 [Lamprigera yunnana]